MGTATKQQKKVPELRFSGFTDEWAETKLGALGETLNGLTYSPDNVHQSGVLVLRSSNVQGRKLSFDDCVHVKVSAEDFNPVIENDILICVRNGSKNLIGKNALITKEVEGVAFGAFMSIFRSDCGKFLFQWFDSDRYKKQVHQNLGATINSINGADLRKFKLAVPVVQEQQKIADFLGSVDAWLDNLRQQKTALETYKRGLMQKLFTQQVRFKDDNGNDFPEWKEKRLGAVAQIIGGGTPDTTNASYWGGEIDWYTPTEVKTKNLQPSVRTITVEGLQQSSAKLLPAGTILLTTRATIGDVAILERQAATNQGFQSLVVNDANSNIFFYYWLQLNKNELVRKANGSTFLEVSSKEIAKLIAKVPVLKEQQKIADFLSAIDQTITAKAEEITKVEQWKKGLMQKMFV
jgi:type I restriction enzyme S subunit